MEMHIDFDNLPNGIKIKKKDKNKLSRFDEYVYNAICKIYDKQEGIMTTEQISCVMPCVCELSDIEDSIQKMNRIIVEWKVSYSDEDYFESGTTLLSRETCRCTYEDGKSEYKIRLYTEPILYLHERNKQEIEIISKQAFRYSENCKDKDELERVLMWLLNAISALEHKYKHKSFLADMFEHMGD